MSDMLSYAPPLLLLAGIVTAAVVLTWRRHGLSLRRPSATAGLRTLEVALVGGNDRLVLAECLGRRYLLAQGSQGLVMLDRWPEEPGAGPLPAPAAAPSGPAA
ncbi:MAG: flagellar biosynthetic protein FliO [Aquabacterium sp.]|nr:flagellar biosynthetic protein FliO [Aquabacterium sp.]